MPPKKKKVAKSKKPRKKAPKKGEKFPTTRKPKPGLRPQKSPKDIDDLEEAKLDKLLGETIDGITKFQAIILRDKQIQPKITLRQLADRYKVSVNCVTNAIYDDRFRSAEIKINTNIFKKVLSLRAKAVENAEEYLQESDKKSMFRFEMTKMFVQKVVDSDASLPEPDVDGPDFEITEDSQNKE